MSSSAAPPRQGPRPLHVDDRVTGTDAVPTRPMDNRPRPVAGAEPACRIHLGEGQECSRRLTAARGNLTRNTIDIRIGSAMSSGAQVTITVDVSTVLVAPEVRSGPGTQDSSLEETTETDRA